MERGPKRHMSPLIPLTLFALLTPAGITSIVAVVEHFQHLPASQHGPFLIELGISLAATAGLFAGIWFGAGRYLDRQEDNIRREYGLPPLHERRRRRPIGRK